MWSALIPAGVGVLGSLLGGRKSKPVRDPREAQLNARLQQMSATGQGLEGEYLQRLRSFDPMAAATQASQAQYSMAMPMIREQLDDLRGQQAGVGRLRSGYGMGDQDRLLTRNLEHLNQSTVARAMEAAQMQAANTGAMGNYAQGLNNQYFDAAYGMMASDQDRRAAEKASRRGMWGSLLGAGIQGAGYVLGRR
jgi:hypothetical protein